VTADPRAFASAGDGVGLNDDGLENLHALPPCLFADRAGFRAVDRRAARMIRITAVESMISHNIAPSPAAPALAVDITGLTKIYGEGRKALDSVDLSIPRGVIFGLLGPNGAGKSTLINILAGLVVKTAGRACVWGVDIDADPRQARASIGVVPQELNLDAFFTPWELLDVQAGLYGVPKRERRTDELLEMVGLTDKAHALARTLSGGMRRRLMMAKAMVHSPPVLVLDEPTAGVDVELRQHLWANVRALASSGTTVLLTTHYLEEAEELCEQIAIIDKGRVVAHDTTRALIGKVDEKRLTLTLTSPATSLPDHLAAMGMTLDPQGRIVFRYKPSRAQVGNALTAVAAAGLAIRDVSSEETDLEDIFLRLTGAGVQK
jgi:ABC-2 type transport system ATP-binding protein